MVHIGCLGTGGSQGIREGTSATIQVRAVAGVPTRPVFMGQVRDGLDVVKGPSSLVTPTSLKPQNLNRILTHWGPPPLQVPSLLSRHGISQPSLSPKMHLGRWGNGEGLGGLSQGFWVWALERALVGSVGEAEGCDRLCLTLRSCVGILAANGREEGPT